MSASRNTIESRLSRIEFTVLISMIMAAVALAIDVVLPAFGDMRGHFELASDSNALAPLVTFFFLGLALGQPFWGPLSDSLGRKPILYAGLVVYVAAAVAAVFAPNLTVLFILRFIGGFGAAGSRVVALSVVRDAYEGEAMAKVMSYVLSIFVLIPIVAPSIGSLVLTIGTWRMVFMVIAAFGVGVGVWSLRLPETLEPQRRIPLNFGRLVAAAGVVLRSRFAMGLTLAQTALFGFFASFIASSQLIIDDVFGLDAWFPLIFGGSAALVGIGMLANTRLLNVMSMRAILRVVFVSYVGAAAVFVLVAVAFGGRPPLALYLLALSPMLFAHALLIPNLNAAALAPMGAIAGTAAAIIGTISTLGGAIIGAVIDRTFNGTITPLAVGALVAAIVALAVFRWADIVWETSVTSEPSLVEAESRPGLPPS
jgi:DHA1 family bicyclomycin/chloramphenicol resistance-like MFS transporter